MSDKLESILFKRGGKFRLAFCRGKEHGCDRNPQHRSSPCELCIVPENENMTLGELVEKIKKGAA